MLRRIVVALIGLLAVVNGSKWLFDGKRLPTLGLGITFFMLAFSVLTWKETDSKELEVIFAPSCR